MNVQVGAVIVTYNADLTVLARTIKSVENQVNKILVVDNGSNNINELKDFLENSFDVQLEVLDQNFGIAKALNVGFGKLENQGYKWIIALDQDSDMPSHAVEMYVGSVVFNRKNVGIIAPKYFDLNWNDNQVADNFTKKDEPEFQKDVFVITSGSLISTLAWQKVGGFDEYLFIDQVDFDFNAKIMLSGFDIWQMNQVVIRHEIGKIIQRPILGRILLYPKNTVFYDHSPIREYYIHRNTIIFAKRYPEYRWHKSQIIVNLVKLREVIVYRGQTMRKLWFGLKGIWQGMLYDPKKDDDFQRFRNSIKKQKG